MNAKSNQKEPAASIGDALLHMERSQSSHRARALLAGFVVTCLALVGSFESLLARQAHVLALAGRTAAHPIKAKEIFFYVSMEGSDAWSGRLAEPNPTRTDGPFRTLAGARDAVRRMKARGTLSRPVTVFLRRGQYNLTAPLIFTPDDSGHARPQSFTPPIRAKRRL